MKPTTLLLTASLVANVAFVSLIATRRPASHSPDAASRPSSPRTQPPANTDALRAALASGDVAALEAAGVSPDIARELALGRMFSRMADKIRATQTKSGGDGRWWRTRSPLGSGATREQQLVARRELTDALMAAFGEDFGLGGGDGSQFAFLPTEKRDALRRIVQDYDEMFAKFSGGGIQLASDREKLRLLRQERDRDIAALLTPEERTAYEMRTSLSGNTVRSRYGDAIESEAEFARIYALQKAFDEKFPRDALTGRIPPEVLRARAEAERQLEADIRGAVGDDRYAALRRAADADVRTIDSLVSRLNLPATTTDAVVSSRESYAAQSQRITNDTSLSVPQRRAQIQALGAQAKSELTRSLGAEAADAYAQRSPWVNMLQNGMAYSTTPQENIPGAFLPGTQSVYPVMPAGTVPAGAQRQFVVNATPPIDGHPPADAFIGGGNVQVMTFSSSATTDTGPAPAAGAAVRRERVPPDPAAQPAPGPAPRP